MFSFVLIGITSIIWDQLIKCGDEFVGTDDYLLTFSALRGYEEEIAAEGEEHLKIAKMELSEEDKGKLSDKLLQVKKGMEVTVCFFEADDVEPAIFDTPAEPARSATHLGNYRTVTGIVNLIDSVYRELKINTGDKNVLGKELPVTIHFDDILDLSGDGLIDIDE